MKKKIKKTIRQSLLCSLTALLLLLGLLTEKLPPIEDTPDATGSSVISLYNCNDKNPLDSDVDLN